MQKNAKDFSEQLNKCLDDLGMPAGIRERAIILGKMLNIPKQQLWGLLEGHLIPDETIVQQIANELEIDTSSLQQE
jgi:hypothetical protein